MISTSEPRQLRQLRAPCVFVCASPWWISWRRASLFSIAVQISHTDVSQIKCWEREKESFWSQRLAGFFSSAPRTATSHSCTATFIDYCQRDSSAYSRFPLCLICIFSLSLPLYYTALNAELYRYSPPSIRFSAIQLKCIHRMYILFKLYFSFVAY